MKTSQLKKILELVDYVYCNNWYLVRKLVDSNFGVIEAKWCDDYKNKNPEWYPLKLTEINTWSTYEECINLKFYIENDRLLCKAIIWDGEMVYGYPKNKRFTTLLDLDDSFLKNIENSINYEFELYLEGEYNKFLEFKKQAWIDDLRNKIL